MRSAGYEPEAVINVWHDRKWLTTDVGRRQKKIRLVGKPLRMFVMKASVAQALNAEEE